MICLGPTTRPMNASGEPQAGPGFQLNKDSVSVRRGLLRSSWRCTGVELVRADSRHSEGGVNVSIGGHVTGEDILKSGCPLLRVGVGSKVLVVVPEVHRRSPRCARVSDSPQVGKKGAQ